MHISYWSLQTSQPTSCFLLLITFFILSCLEYYLSSEYRDKIIAAIIIIINIFYISFVKITVHDLFRDLIMAI